MSYITFSNQRETWSFLYKPVAKETCIMEIRKLIGALVHTLRRAHGFLLACEQEHLGLDSNATTIPRAVPPVSAVSSELLRSDPLPEGITPIERVDDIKSETELRGVVKDVGPHGAFIDLAIMEPRIDRPYFRVKGLIPPRNLNITAQNLQPADRVVVRVQDVNLIRRHVYLILVSRRTPDAPPTA